MVEGGRVGTTGEWLEQVSLDVGGDARAIVLNSEGSLGTTWVARDLDYVGGSSVVSWCGVGGGVGADVGASTAVLDGIVYGGAEDVG